MFAVIEVHSSADLLNSAVGSRVSTRADGGCIPLLASLCDRKNHYAPEGHVNNTNYSLNQLQMNC